MALRRQRAGGPRTGGQEKSPHRGRLLGKGDRSGSRRGEGVGGLRSSGDVGERMGIRTRPSEGGPC